MVHKVEYLNILEHSTIEAYEKSCPVRAENKRKELLRNIDASNDCRYTKDSWISNINLNSYESQPRVSAGTWIDI